MDPLQDYNALFDFGERDLFEKILGMEAGFLLDFTDRTFDDFFRTTMTVNPKSNPELFERFGTSKAKKLRSFITYAPPAKAALLLRKLWEYLAKHPSDVDLSTNSMYHKAFWNLVTRLEGSIDYIDTSPIEVFEQNETLEELVASIRRDIDAGRPRAAMDRLHTYCMKRFASLIKQHSGEECLEIEALHARVGKYLKLLKKNVAITELTERIIKNSISLFDKMNDLRNNRSLAHDNDDLASTEEAILVFESVSAILKFIKRIDPERI